MTELLANQIQDQFKVSAFDAKYCCKYGFDHTAHLIEIEEGNYWKTIAWLDGMNYFSRLDYIILPDSFAGRWFIPYGLIKFLFKDPELATLVKLMYG